VRRRAVLAVLTASLLTLGIAAPASALPDDTDWTESGLREMVRVSGHLTWSVDGLGTADGAGDLQVEKPDDATVLAAYFMAAQTWAPFGGPSGILLAGTDIVFTHRATDVTSGSGFVNLFADVTDVVAPVVDAAPAGLVDLPVVEQSPAEGTALLVVFEDPAVPLASVMLYFGVSDSTGSTFTLPFPALTEPQTEDLRMSVGSSYSYGEAQTSIADVNGQRLSDHIGHTDDCETFDRADPATHWSCGNGALLTVGGVGDSLENPAQPTEPWTPITDDELYSLSPFVSVGDTEIVVSTVNPSQDDNLFMAAFYLRLVGVEGAEPIGDPVTPVDPVEPVDPDDQVDPVVPAAPELPATGAETAGAVAFGIATLVAGALLVVMRGRRRVRA